MIEWHSEDTTLDISVSEYCKMFAGEDFSFSLEYHRKEGNIIVAMTEWTVTNSVTLLKPREKSKQRKFSKDIMEAWPMDCFEHQLMAKQHFLNTDEESSWIHRMERIKLPPSVSGSKDHLWMHCDHFRQCQPQSDGSIIIESAVRPISGFLKNCFTVHHSYQVLPLTQNKSVFRFRGRLIVHAVPLMNGVIERIGVPYCHQSQDLWISRMKEHIQSTKDKMVKINANEE